LFNPLKTPEAGMEWIKCPKCRAPVNQGHVCNEGINNIKFQKGDRVRQEDSERLGTVEEVMFPVSCKVLWDGERRNMGRSRKLS
jgi:hypothetical protein